MNALQERLEAGAKAWAIKSNYNRPSMPEVLALNKQYRIENPTEYGYNSNIKCYVISKGGLSLSAEALKYLDTEVYLSQQDLDKENQKVYSDKMLAAGWLPLTEGLVRKAFADKKRLEVEREATSVLLTTSKVKHIYKPFVSHEDKVYLMEPRATRKGFLVYQMQNAFCKIA